MAQTKLPVKVGKFWAVMQIGSNYIMDNRVYATAKDAETAAERFAQQYKTQFFVVEAVSVVGPTTPPIEWTILDK